MAKRLIILGKTNAGDTDSVSVALWFPITSGQQTVASGSAWTGASAAENTAIQNGNIVEEVRGFSFPKDTTIASMKDVLEKAWATRNAQIAGKGPNQNNGVFFDSVTGWSVQ